MIQKILFIVNPISGGKDKSDFTDLLARTIHKETFNYQVLYTQSQGHAQELAQKAVEDKYNIVVAVGGDGTINEVASALVGTNTALGIIPYGSGNGLARTLHIAMSPLRALQQLNRAIVKSIDVGTLDGKYFFNVAGLGFEAQISHLFQQGRKRGIWGYTQAVISEVVNHQAQTYRVETPEKTFETKAYSISFANSTQFGNNIHVAPLAQLDDGRLEMVIIEQQSKFKLPLLGLKMYNKTVHQSKGIISLPIVEVEIQRPKEDYVHLDGEPFWAGKTLQIGILKHSLKVMIPHG